MDRVDRTRCALGLVLGLLMSFDLLANAIDTPVFTGSTAAWARASSSSQPSGDPFFAWIHHVAGPADQTADKSTNGLMDVIPGNAYIGPALVAVHGKAEQPDSVIPIPEPTTWLMVLAGLAMFGLVVWRRSK